MVGPSTSPRLTHPASRDSFARGRSGQALQWNDLYRVKSGDPSRLCRDAALSASINGSIRQSGRDRRLEQPQDAYLSHNLLRRGVIVNDAYHNHAALSHSGAFAFRLQCSLRNLSVGQIDTDSPQQHELLRLDEVSCLPAVCMAGLKLIEVYSAGVVAGIELDFVVSGLLLSTLENRNLLAEGAVDC